ncbi:MAG: hypothetical protein A2018_03485 [Alphaproteobacteria bacterium GWF2_58_20]|nr:MAG: hypothetical protein A2018_03485 [Alphaproteobacteria bacterium GWF2_58_20]
MQHRFSRFLAFGFAFLPSLAFGSGTSSVPGPVPASVVRVVDGDTLLVRARIWVRQDVETLVRILGIDAPEAGKQARCPAEEKGGVLATSAMKNLVRGGLLNLYDVRSDKYGGRVLARVENAGGQDVAKVLLARNLVRPYAGNARGTWCKAP